MSEVKPEEDKVLLRHTSPLTWFPRDAQFMETVFGTESWKKLEIILDDRLFNMVMDGSITPTQLNVVKYILSGIRDFVPERRKNLELLLTQEALGEQTTMQQDPSDPEIPDVKSSLQGG